MNETVETIGVVLGAEGGETALDAARRVVRERDEAVARNAKTYCAYCGEQFPIDGEHAADAVGAHIAACKKHPMRATEARLKESLAEVARLKAEAHSWADIPLMIQKRREFARDDRRWELFKIVAESMLDDYDNNPALLGEKARNVTDALLAEFERASEPAPVPDNGTLAVLLRDFLTYYSPRGGVSDVPLGPFERAAKALGVTLREPAAEVDCDSRTITEQPTPPAEPRPICKCGHAFNEHHAPGAECIYYQCKCDEYTPAEPKPAEPEWLTHLINCGNAMRSGTPRLVADNWIAAVAAAREACKK